VAKTRILVVDDHAGMRDGICAMVNARADMAVVAVASNGREAIEQFRAVLPDVSILDWNLPFVGGEGVIATIIREFPQARFIVITALSDEVCAQRATDLGAKAYIHKDMLRRELLPAIYAVHQGQLYFPERNANSPKKDY
jgi:DNA-binding NarL/FixJ family response regulator